MTSLIIRNDLGMSLLLKAAQAVPTLTSAVSELGEFRLAVGSHPEVHCLLQTSLPHLPVDTVIQLLLNYAEYINKRSIKNYKRSKIY